jgi:hypothetical protein
MNQLRVSLPNRWNKLWHLEKLLPHPPRRVGNALVYDIAPKMLQLYISPEQIRALAQILEKTTDHENYQQWFKQVMKAKVTNLQQGFLLTCCDSATLISLRSDPAFQPVFDQVVAPNQIFIPQSRALRDLKILAKADIVQDPHIFADHLSSDATCNDQALAFALLKLAWAATLRGMTCQLSTVQLEKLIATLPAEDALLAIQSAEREIKTPDFLPPTATIVPDDQLSPIHQKLQEAIETLSTVTFFYQKANGHQARQYTLAPLMIERRGGHDYLVAFSENHCQRRTFRIDRIISIN